MTEAWPALPLPGWQPTYTTLHLWTQILGKTRLALSPPQNHCWHTALYVSTAGLTTSPMPSPGSLLEIELDLLRHRVVGRSSEGATAEFPLATMTVAEFFERYRGLLRSLAVEVSMRPTPCEVADQTPFHLDRTHGAYDPDAASRCWRILVQADRVMQGYRGDFLGKSSPVHFWWGAFDLACTRFSGRAAPPHPGGVPYLADHVVRDAYSHECMSVGWWPGGGAGVVREPPVLEPSFYAYTYPGPPGYADAAIRPAAAYYHPTMGEWLLPYEAVRGSADPDATLREFLDSTYRAGATLAGWDRAALERPA